MIINLFGDSFAYAGHAFEFTEAGAGDGPCGAEMKEQGPLAASADPCDLVKRGLSHSFGSLRAMCADRKPVRLITQALEEVKYWIARIEGEWRQAGHKKALPPGIAVWSFRDADERDVGD